MAIGRITKAAGIGVAAAGLLIGTAGVAQADRDSYIRVLEEHGPVTDPTMQFNKGKLICENLRAGEDARASFNPITNAFTPDYMIEAAQHELCPDTVQGPK